MTSSPKQAKFMRAVAHNPVFAAKVKVPQAVGEEFETADKRKQVVAVLLHAKAKAMGY